MNDEQYTDADEEWFVMIDEQDALFESGAYDEFGGQE